MLVDGVMMVHVVLHLGHDPAEIGHETSENARFIHPAQYLFGVVSAGQHAHEQRIGVAIAPNAFVDQAGIACRLSHRLRVDGQFFAVCEGEHLDQPHRIGGKKPIIGHPDLPAAQREAVQFRRPPDQLGQPARLGKAFVEMGKEQPGKVAHRLGHQEIVPHEAFHRRHATLVRAPFGVAQPRCQLALYIEGQPFLGTPGNVVEVDAHRPQKAFGAAELTQFTGRQQPLVNQFGDGFDLIGIFADPEQRVQVTQAALAFLQIGLDDIAAVAHLFMAFVAFGEFLRGKGLGGAGDNFLAEALGGFLVQRLVAPDVTRFEQRGADRHIGLGHAHHVVERSRRMADLQPHVPQHV